MKTILLAAALAAFAQGQDKLPTGQQVLEHFRELTGAEALEKAKTQVITSKMEFTGRGMSGTVVEYRKKPKLHSSEAEFEGMRVLGLEPGVAAEHVERVLAKAERVELPRIGTRDAL